LEIKGSAVWIVATNFDRCDPAFRPI
jgi:hypothetical protein